MSQTIPSRKRQHAQSIIANSFASIKPTSLSLQPRLVVHFPHHQLEKCSARQGLCQKRKFQPKMAYQTQATAAPAPSPSPSSNRLTPFDKLQTSLNPDPSSADLSKPSLFPPAESSETWNHITVMNEKVGLSSDMGDEWSSQTARKEQSDNARWPQLSVKKLSFLSYCLQYARSCPCDWFFPSLAKASHAKDLNFTT